MHILHVPSTHYTVTLCGIFIVHEVPIPPDWVIGMTMQGGVHVRDHCERRDHEGRGTVM